jgi:S-adenosylmethionine hydrolase
MDASVIYQYEAGGAEQGNVITIRSDTMDVNPSRMHTNSPHMVCDTVTLQAEEEEEEAIEALGKEPKEYVVSKCMHVLTRTAEHGPGLTVYVSVADPGS